MRKVIIKKNILFLAFLVILIFQFPFVFAKFKTLGNTLIDNKPCQAFNRIKKDIKILPSNFSVFSSNLFDSLQLEKMGLKRQVFDFALKGFNYMSSMGLIKNSSILSIVDFSKPSSEKRLYIIDLQKVQVLYKTYVAHGSKSGKEFASQFSNSISSNQSSLGFYETLDTYIGVNGYSLRLQGLETGFNDNANKRAIVLHGAAYVDERLVKLQGYIGRSWGCPAVPPALHRAIIDKIKNGSCLFIYSPNNQYLTHSKILDLKKLPS
jgi:hypothetical protein